MKTLQPSIVSARLCTLILGPAVGLVLSGCTHYVTSRAAPESQIIDAAGLPAGWSAPRAVRKVAPVVPEHLRRSGQEGEVHLMCHVDAKGDVRHIAAVEPSHGEFVAAASAALQQWKFTAGTRDGQPVTMNVLVPMRFVFADAPVDRPNTTYLAATPWHQPRFSEPQGEVH